MNHVVSYAETTEIPYPELTVFAYSSGDDFASASMITVEGSHPRILSTHSGRVYLVVEGTGWFEVDGTTKAVTAKDVVFLPKNTPYSYGGQMELFLVHAPGYLAEGDVHL
ncbi:hypothetical protein KPL76_08430 [Subtercola sp. PAMC28395]|uniref:cupin domain-containing protein n=1 Tax=Subtercola sp. PAMC28395 TaxID=2846775 RepID=UPI001C0D5A7D|nr:hypothetical protein [Subtercola sp. PAMC28395]QWT22828.1 hypothetical protein KPL76_08430 [Subtercola sp. PAMC28395]